MEEKVHGPGLRIGKIHLKKLIPRSSQLWKFGVKKGGSFTSNTMKITHRLASPTGSEGYNRISLGSLQKKIEESGGLVSGISFHLFKGRDFYRACWRGDRIGNNAGSACDLLSETPPLFSSMNSSKTVEIVGDSDSGKKETKGGKKNATNPNYHLRVESLDEKVPSWGGGTQKEELIVDEQKKMFETSEGKRTLEKSYVGEGEKRLHMRPHTVKDETFRRVAGTRKETKRVGQSTKMLPPKQEVSKPYGIGSNEKRGSYSQYLTEKNGNWHPG